MLVIGLTGGIGSGKTTVAEEFANLGASLIDADLLAREVVEPETPALAAIAQRFGPAILDSNGFLNRSELRQIVFANQDHKVWLEQLLHPLIRQLMLSRIQSADSPYCILVSPLLLETDQSALVQRVLVVDVAPQTQLQRTLQRDSSSVETIKAIMAAQISREARLEKADDVITNDGSTDELKAKILSLHYKYLELSGKHDA
ncbi:MAG: dephospho-CoA kinase [Pseudohongiellaceae bacterium]|jgi:dephospho-CoA kinase